jgi:peptidoglycan/xylan/chitin deacetylase (PgdA/CDA1 family)
LRIALGWQGYLESRAAGAAILCYHGVVERCTEPDLEAYFVDVATLRAHLTFLRCRYEIVPLAQIVAALATGAAISSRWVAITFDDALANQVTRAAAILAEQKAAWSLAVPAGLIGSGRSIWSYELSLLLLRYWEQATIPDPLDSAVQLPMGSIDQRQKALARVRSCVLAPPAGDLALRYVDTLVNAYGPERFRERLASDDRFRLASWGQLRELQSQGVELLSHGGRHLPPHAGLGEADLEHEIDEPRKVLQAKLGFSPRGFVFPHGRPYVDAGRRLELAGYEFALTSRPGRVTGTIFAGLLPRYDAEHSLDILRRHLLTEGQAGDSLPAESCPPCASGHV